MNQISRREAVAQMHRPDDACSQLWWLLRSGDTMLKNGGLSWFQILFERRRICQNTY